MLKILELKMQDEKMRHGMLEHEEVGVQNKALCNTDDNCVRKHGLHSNI